jgi:pentafunctional AROM polypeptide
MSPKLHNTGFQVLQLPHVYELLETAKVDESVKATITSPDFGGASVTIPLKVQVIPLLDQLSPAADAIGAVNTIVPRSIDGGGSRKILYGDNTDWMGICNVISPRLSSSSIQGALVIGAGGTARAAIFALHKLGAKTIYLCNRTRSKAEALQQAFSSTRVEVLDNLEVESWPQDGLRLDVIVSTVPASCIVTGDDIDGGGLHVPKTVFGEAGGVVVDMAYRPALTPLLKLAEETTGGKWKTVPGLEILLEQGYVQFELWTSRKCPRKEVSKKVWEAYTVGA